MTGEARCHCGAPVKVHDGGFTRGLCADCDEVRCDVDGSCGAVTGEALSPAQEPGARVTQNSGETPAQVIAALIAGSVPTRKDSDD